MNFRLIRSGIMMSRPGATYSIAAVFAGIFPKRHAVRASGSILPSSSTQESHARRVDQTGRQC